ncbi:hypothetical protein D3C76_1592060 [compost metagenome]
MNGQVRNIMDSYCYLRLLYQRDVFPRYVTISVAHILIISCCGRSDPNEDDGVEGEGQWWHFTQ